MSNGDNKLWSIFLQSLRDENNQTGSDYQIKDFLNLDDPEDDPDFTLPLEDNFEMPDLSHIPHVPKQETLELIKDAFDLVPDLFPDDSSRQTKSKTNISTNKKSNSQEESQNESIALSEKPQTYKENTSSKPKTSKEAEREDSVPTNRQTSGHFRPEFSKTQLELLNEQLRNHVQMLAQISLVSYCSNEYTYIYDEASNLLRILDCLKLSPLDPNSPTQEANRESCHSLVSSDFEIINLNEAIRLVNTIQNIDKDQIDMKNDRVPMKCLEIILDSPVFYNTNLLPNFTKLDHQSHFKRSHFSDNEKILLILGFEKFKHLEKSECCECIRENLLPHRSCTDIKKQIHTISSKETLQAKLKELIKANKQQHSSNCKFESILHYKSPYAQTDSHSLMRLQLPSMYTVVLEKLKFVKMQHELKARSETPQQNFQLIYPKGTTISNNINEQVDVILIDDAPKNSESKRKKFTDNFVNNRSQSNEVIIQSTPLKEVSKETTFKKTPETNNHQTATIANNDEYLNVSFASSVGYDKETVTTPKKPSRRRRRSSSPFSTNSSNGKTNRPQSPSTTLNTTSASVSFTPNKAIKPKPSLQSPVYIFTNPSSMNANNLFVQSNPIRPSNSKSLAGAGAAAATPPICLPSGFKGTIIINPTIHVHMSRNEVDLSHYKEIKPKEAKVFKKD